MRDDAPSCLEEPDEGPGSITRWLGDLKHGGDSAAQHLWERYFDRLTRLAFDYLRGNPRRVSDEEDAALSAFNTFVAKQRAGGLPQVQDRDDLWRILVVLTLRKVKDQVNHERRIKRGGGRKIWGDADRERAADGTRGLDLDDVEGREPSPLFAALFADEVRQRLDSLPDARCRQVALLRLEGHKVSEVASALGVTNATVKRDLVIVRKRWSQEEPP